MKMNKGVEWSFRKLNKTGSVNQGSGSVYPYSVRMQENIEVI